jgi:biotin synthase
MQLSELTALHDLPFFQLLDRARAVHRAHWPDQEVQLCTLLSIKTGGCSENCGYCSQSAHHSTDLKRQPLLTLDQVMPHAEKAREAGSTRFCMGAAWKGVREGDRKFEQVLEHHPRA